MEYMVFFNLKIIFLTQNKQSLFNMKYMLFFNIKLMVFSPVILNGNHATFREIKFLLLSN